MGLKERRTRFQRSTVRALRSTLVWRIAPWIFVSVLLIEGLAVVPAVAGHRRALQDALIARIEARIDTVLDHVGADAALAEAGPQLLGARIERGEVVLASYGEAPSADCVAGARSEPGPSVLETCWRTHDERIVVRLDASAIDPAMERHVAGLFAMLLPGSVLATVVSVLALYPTVMLPLERLRESLLESTATHSADADPMLSVVDEVRLLVHELESARMRAEEAERIATDANRAKSTFLAVVSHELRTPLNAIIGYSELLLEGPGPREARDTRDLGSIRDAARHLLSLINQVLDLSRIEAHREELTFEPFDLGELIVGTANGIGPLMIESNNHLRFEIDPALGMVVSDPGKVRQCLLNLLANANKFTTSGQIVVRAARRSGRVVVEVTDSGIGIEVDALERIFEPFVQGDGSSTRRFGGSGLGLTITRRLMDLLGGTVEVTSRPGHGSTFVLALPERSARGVTPAVTPLFG